MAVNWLGMHGVVLSLLLRLANHLKRLLRVIIFRSPALNPDLIQVRDVMEFHRVAIRWNDVNDDHLSLRDDKNSIHLGLGDVHVSG